MAQAVAEIDQILAFFGVENGSKKGKAIEQMKPLSVHQRILSGFPSEVLSLASKAFGLDVNDLAKLLGVSTKTIQRKLSSGTALTKGESNQFYRGIHIFIFAAEVFRDIETARQWMSEPQPALGGYIPMDLLETVAGAEEVYNLLGRIKYAVIS
jgi:putative toxin-antitoxin system antitoxin component (TIGR02293 family)